MKTTMQLIVATALWALAGSADAAPYNFKGFSVDVEAWAGSGSNETILVVDWNRLDNGAATISESHAFGYRWDGVKYQSNMLAAFDSAGILAVTTFYGGMFVSNIAYNDADDNEMHAHIEPGSWNLASTSNPHAYWGTWDNSEWDFNDGGIDVEPLADGRFVGANAILFFAEMPGYGNDQLTIPVPEPVSASLLGFGALALLRRRKVRA